MWKADGANDSYRPRDIEVYLIEPNFYHPTQLVPAIYEGFTLSRKHYTFCLLKFDDTPYK